MTITEKQKKLLTEEVLGECWHERRTEDVGKKPWDLSHCAKCGELVKLQSFDRRTFDNDTDMMAVYRAINRKGVWGKFFDWAYEEYWKENSGTHRKFTAWLFCLDSEDYESRCCLVAQWLEEVKK